MWGIRLIRTCLVVVVGTVVLVGVPVLTATAGAAPATCTTTYSAPGTRTIRPKDEPFGYSVDWIDIQVPDQRVVVDVDWGFDVSFASDSADLGWVLNSPQSQANEPSSKADLDGRSAEGQWQLLITNIGTHTGTWGNYTLTLTVDCDADKDGAADQSDNCLIVANPDQSNIDDDALGDACDLDIDGDALANAGDGCPLVATTTTSGCPSAGRTASLRYAKTTRRLKVMVRSDAPACRAQAEVTLFRTRPGRDTKLVVAPTNAKGRKTWKAPARSGRYYVKVTKSYAVGQAECGRARSSQTRVR